MPIATNKSQGLNPSAEIRFAQIGKDFDVIVLYHAWHEYRTTNPFLMALKGVSFSRNCFDVTFQCLTTPPQWHIAPAGKPRLNPFDIRPFSQERVPYKSAFEAALLHLTCFCRIRCFSTLLLSE